MDVSTKDRGVYVFGPFRLDPLRRSLTRDNDPIKLAARLFDTLLYLVENPGRLVEKDELLGAVWGSRIVEEGNLSQSISQLRKILRDEGEAAPVIGTVAGRGYRLVADVRHVTGAELTTPSLSQPLPPQPAPARPPPRNIPGKAWFALAAAVLTLAAAAGIAWYGSNRRPHEPVPAVLASAAPFSPPPHSLAVLAFSDLSGNQGDALFGDGLAEELINTLGRINALQVAARTSAFSFKTQSATVPEIARKLNVAAVLEGSVRRDGARMRVSTQLIDGQTGYQLWSAVYDRDQHDLLQVQVDIAQAVSAALRVSLVGVDPSRLTLGGTANPAAFEAYLRGMALLRTFRDNSFQQALDSFDQAVRLDPDFARAHAGRAYALVNLALDPAPNLVAADVRGLYTNALAAADRAVALAPEMATGHAARSAVLDNGFLDSAAASAEAARSQALEPGNAAIEGNFAQVAMDAGHFADGVAAARRSAALDPLRADVWDNLAYVLMEDHLYVEAAAAVQHAVLLHGGTPERTADTLARIDLLRGRPEQSLAECAHGTRGLVQICSAMAYHALGRTAEAAAALARFSKTDDGNSPYNYAQIFAQWGQRDHALDWLEKAYAAHDQVMSQMKADPLVDPIRDSPRFKAVEKALKFPS